MIAINFYEEAKKLEEKGEHRTINNIIKADTFDIDIIVEDNLAEARLHECGKDEFFYVLKGEGKAQVEDNIVPLKEGESILVKAGTKHKFVTPSRVWRLVITKHPHKHKFYE